PPDEIRPIARVSRVARSGRISPGRRCDRASAIPSGGRTHSRSHRSVSAGRASFKTETNAETVPDRSLRERPLDRGNRVRRPGQEIALPELRAGIANGREFVRGLDALGDDLRADLVEEPYQRADELALLRLLVDAANQREVELHDARFQIEHA